MRCLPVTTTKIWIVVAVPSPPQAESRVLMSNQAKVVIRAVTDFCTFSRSKPNAVICRQDIEVLGTVELYKCTFRSPVCTWLSVEWWFATEHYYNDGTESSTSVLRHLPEMFLAGISTVDLTSQLD
jgi:hypothetical protein